MNFKAHLQALVPLEVREAIGYPRIRIGTKKERRLHRNVRAKKLARLTAKRQAYAKAMEAARLQSMEHIYPPQQGHRRPEWSSAVAGRWSQLNGLPLEEQ